VEHQPPMTGFPEEGQATSISVQEKKKGKLEKEAAWTKEWAQVKTNTMSLTAPTPSGNGMEGGSNRTFYRESWGAKVRETKKAKKKGKAQSIC